MKNIIKKNIKKVVVGTAYYSGLSGLFGSIHSQKIFCVGYHSINSDKNKKEFQYDLYSNISISAKNFEEQIFFMKKNGHTFIHFSDLKNLENLKLKKPTIVFFDDGFKDVLENALPILKKHNIKATIFIPTGIIERTHILWTVKLRFLMSKSLFDIKKVEKIISDLKKLEFAERDKEIKSLEVENKM